MPVVECLHLPILQPGLPGSPPSIFLNPAFSLVMHGPTVMAEVGFDPALFPPTPLSPTPAPVPVATPLPSSNLAPGVATPSSIALPGSNVPVIMQSVMTLVDTGAATSCIDDTLAQQLNMPLINQIPSAGVGGRTTLNLYLGRFVIPQLGFSRAGAFIGALMTQGGMMHRAIIGRDVLSSMLLIYDGISGRVKLAI
jgi:hypothetical protein